MRCRCTYSSACVQHTCPWRSQNTCLVVMGNFGLEYLKPTACHPALRLLSYSMDLGKKELVHTTGRSTSRSRCMLFCLFLGNSFPTGFALCQTEVAAPDVALGGHVNPGPKGCAIAVWPGYAFKHRHTQELQAQALHAGCNLA